MTREPLLQGRIFGVERCCWTTGDGVEVSREIVRHPGAVTIVPILDDGRIVMIRNWRMAVGGPLWELPAGKREQGESPAETAARELTEETGFTAATLEPLGAYYTSPGFADEYMYAFVATGLVSGALHLEPGEEVETICLQPSQVGELIDQGELIDGKTLSALMLWERAGGSVR